MCILILFLLAAQLQGDQGDARLLEQLRQRGQYRKAEEYGTQRWQRSDLSDHARVELAIQLALTHSDQALKSAPPQRDELWKKADDVCAALVEQFPNNPRRVLVEVQRALIAIARGEQSRAENAIADAQKFLRTARHQLADVAESIEEQLINARLRRPRNNSAEMLTAGELESLAANVSLQLARAERQLALCYGPGTPDRDDALLQAIARLSATAKQTPPSELTWKARVELARCHCDLGQIESAKRLIESWRRDNPSSIVAAELKSALQSTAVRPDPSGTRHTQSAAEAHRQLILRMAGELRANSASGDSQEIKAYEDLLREHLANWPAKETADEVRLWLGQLLAARRDFAAAIPILQQVQPAAAMYGESVALLIRCYEGELQKLKTNESAHSAQQRLQLLATVTKYLQPVITGQENRWPDAWTERQRNTALGLARLHLRFGEQPSPYAERLLLAALGGEAAIQNAAADQKWHASARAALVAVLARNGKVAEANALVTQLDAVPASELLETLSLIEPTSSNSQGDAQLGALMHSLVQLLDRRRSELSENESAQLNLYRAAAAAAVGDRTAALAQYAALAAQHPDNGAMQEQYAAVLASLASEPELREALARWTQIENRSERGGMRWQRARRARLELLVRLGEKQEAEKLLRLTQLLHPDWGQSADQPK